MNACSIRSVCAVAAAGVLLALGGCGPWLITPLPGHSDQVVYRDKPAGVTIRERKHKHFLVLDGAWSWCKPDQYAGLFNTYKLHLYRDGQTIWLHSLDKDLAKSKTPPYGWYRIVKMNDTYAAFFFEDAGDGPPPGPTLQSAG